MLREAPDEKKVRTCPVKLFNIAVTELEDRIVEDLLDDDVETALKMMTEAYNTVHSLHKAYLAARQGSDSEELSDDPDDTRWMEKHKKSRADVLAKYHEWKKSKAAGEVEAAAAREEKKLAREKPRKKQSLPERRQRRKQNLPERRKKSCKS